MKPTTTLNLKNKNEEVPEKAGFDSGDESNIKEIESKLLLIQAPNK